MKITTPSDYADARRTADTLCSKIAFGDDDPVALAPVASDALGSIVRHRRHLMARSLRHAA